MIILQIDGEAGFIQYARERGYYAEKVLSPAGDYILISGMRRMES